MTGIISFEARMSYPINRVKFRRYHRLMYALAGALVGLGAPVGWFFFRFFLHHHGELARLAHEFSMGFYFYIYLTISTVTAFVIFGYYLGRQGDILEKEKQYANSLAITDGLTGLYNHRYIQEHLKAELERSHRYDTPLTCLMLDIDDFKKVNDHYGHPFGDHVLHVLARILREQVRRVDTVGRYGGEEFLILMPHTLAVDVLPVADRIRAEFQEYPFHVNGQDIRVTVSTGIATQSPGRKLFKEPGALLQAADEALYEAKKQGKNRIHIWSTSAA